MAAGRQQESDIRKLLSQSAANTNTTVGGCGNPVTVKVRARSILFWWASFRFYLVHADCWDFKHRFTCVYGQYTTSSSIFLHGIFCEDSESLKEVGV
jgi:hypothetical protein